MVIKSTIPVGYCQKLYQRYGKINLLFSPEFLRESKALEDNLYPSRIIVGYPKLMDIDESHMTDLKQKAEVFAQLLVEGAIGGQRSKAESQKQALDLRPSTLDQDKGIPVLFMGLDPRKIA